MNCIIPEENYHYIEIFMRGEIDTSVLKEPKNLEANKCEGESEIRCLTRYIHMIVKS